MSYDIFKYWSTREKPNNPKSFIEDRLCFDINFIGTYAAGQGPVFELGPGIGRTFGAYDRGREVQTLDVTDRYCGELQKAAAKQGVVLKSDYIADLSKPFPFEDDAFDCGVAFQVFLHQPPDVFELAFSEMARICKSLVFNAGIHANSPAAVKAKNDHVFAHDYLAAAERNRLAFSRLAVRDMHIYAVTERV